MSQKTRRIPLILLLFSLLVAILGQYYLSHKQDLMWDGLFMYLVAMLLFGWVAARLEAKPRSERTSTFSLWGQFYDLLHRSPMRLGALLLGLLLVFYVASSAGRRAPGVACWDLLALWIMSMALTAGAFVNWRALPGHIARAGRECIRNPEWALVLILAVATFLLRAMSLESIPYVLSGDEASMGLEARSVLNGVSTNPFVTGWLSHPTLFFFIQAAFLRVFGQNTAALRLPSACISAATVVLLYLFARRYYGRVVAVVAAVFFAGYHFAIHYGRLGVNNIWDPFFALAALFFVSRGLESKRLGYLVLGGTLLGLAVYFYTGARLIPILLLVYILYWALTERNFLQDHLSHLIVVFLGALVAALPMLAFFRTHMNDMMARWTMMGIFPSGWVDYQVQQTGKSVLAVVWGQFLKAALAYNYYPDPTFWYHPGIPLFEFWPSVLFVFGVVYAACHLRERRYLLLILWYLAVIVFGGALLENPPSSFRLVLSIPAAVMLMAVGVERVVDFLRRALGARIMPFKFTQASKSVLGFNLLAAVNSGRLKVYAPDGSDDYRELMLELDHARGVYRPNQTLNFFVDPNEGHDDYLMSLALCVQAASGLSPKKATGTIREM